VPDGRLAVTGSAASKVQARSEMEWSALAQLHSPFGDSGAHDGRSKLPSASQVLKAQGDDEEAAFSESRTASTATSSSESERDCEDCAHRLSPGNFKLNIVDLRLRVVTVLVAFTRMQAE
jgi:hypothetical protein